MAYDEELAHRVRDLIGVRDGVTERKMFGGLCFLFNGHMTCGIVGDTLMLRLTRHLAEDALREPHVRPMDFTGRPMKTMIYVDPQGLRGRSLRAWIDRAVAHAATLAPKQG